MSKCRMVSLNSKYRIRKVVMRGITGRVLGEILSRDCDDMSWFR